MSGKKHKLVILTGPTAIGKTALSIELAQRLKTVIVSADSRQVYKELTIGTAVPENHELQAVPHYMLQNKTIDQYYSAGKYELEVIELLTTLFQKNKVLLMVGGSGMYIDAVCYGIDDIPDIDPEIRQKLIERLETEGTQSLRNELKQIDPLFYKTADIQNPKRILKALEVYYTSGKKYSELRTNRAKPRDFDFLKIALNTNRNELYTRINHRVDLMMQAGLLDEVKRLKHKQHLNSLNTVGYKELFAFLNHELSLAEAVEQIKRNSRRYAKRQISWLKRDESVRWFEPTEKQKIFEAVEQFIKKQ